MTRIVYVSTDSMPFVPVEVTDPYVPDRTEYPLVLEEPRGLAQPKYDWANSEWTEDHTGSIADQLSALQDNVSDLTDALALSITGGVVSGSTSTDTADELPSTSASESNTTSELSSMSASESDTADELPPTSTSESDTADELSSTSTSEA